MSGETKPRSIPRESLRLLVEAFYGRVRHDDLIGPVFDAAVEDWPAHFEHLTAFWDAVINGVPGFQGRPLAKHMRLDLTPAMFERWLDIWIEVTGERFDAASALLLREKAWQIGRSFQAALSLKDL